MAANKIDANKIFDWGDSARIADSAPEKYRGIRVGSICGIRAIEDEITARRFEEEIGALLYLVEDASGEWIEIPERFLKPL